jgi:formate hydrogenlyase subunit 3/multisubunit Na+/H+ antiporter MnhD subunit
VTGLLLVATWVVPLAMLAACLSPRARARMPSWLWLAPLPGLAAALIARGEPLVMDESGMRFTLALDPAAAMLLGVAALLWTAAGVYARTWLRDDAKAGRFAEWWLLTLAGSLGVFLAADIFTFYIAFSMVSLAAWGLVAHDDTAQARRAVAIYLGLAVVGEICLLLAFALLATETPGASLAIRDLVAALPSAPGHNFTIALLIAGFGLKIGLVPLHVWMPLAYSAAPHPAAAVLSGAAVKAGVIGLIRFLPFAAALPGWGTALAVAGLVAAFYGVAIGITQANPKVVLAYSSVSQMGFLATVFGMGLAAGDPSTGPTAAFYAAHHVLVKGALFLALGVAAASGTGRAWPVLAPAAVIALGLAGLPPTGGALAKLAVKDVLGKGVLGALAALSAAGTTLLMLHFLRLLAATDSRHESASAPAGLTLPWLGTAIAAVAGPWALRGTTASGVGWDPFAPAALAALLWPIALGAVLALGLRRFGDRLPRVPEGDLVVAGASAVRAARTLGEALERADGLLRRWPVAGVSLLALAILLGAALLACHPSG